MIDQDLANLSLQEFVEFIIDPQCDLEMIRAILTDEINLLLDEKTSIENQLNSAKTRFIIYKERSDPQWFNRAKAAHSHRKRIIDKLNKKLSFINKANGYRLIKMMETGENLDTGDSYKQIKYESIKFFFEKVFCDICRDELEEDSFNRIKRMAIDVIEILQLRSLGEYYDFSNWRQTFIKKHNSNYDYRKMALIYTKADNHKV